ncbi:pyruvate kinase alpha/beta domain-containing protein [Methanomethylovorans sp.]|uniref:pyruvate kinase alpha/beta domain-containing protein n=1 Tax=Methanomethylovorans sp. TaxID=2758717 RepID=UPI000AF434FD|nr:pyruvate kinase alpha/beta domain-containing protein [Methanomethylovorans sp.]
MEKTIIYLESTGKENTQLIIDAALKRAEELGIGQIVVSSTTGYTAREIAKAAKGKMLKIVCVSHQYGVKEDGKWEMDADTLKELQDMEVEVVTQSHLFSGIERAISNKLGGASRTDVISNTLRSLFGQGFKVVVEITMMAADSGKIPVTPGTEVIAIAGTGHGADVAVVMKPAHSQRFFDAQIREIIAMPRAK